MANPQLYPLEVNPKTGEPFLRLRNHKNVILTPPRMEDAPVLVSFLNDPRICDCLSGPPYPYTLEHAEFWLKMIKSFSDGVLRELEEGRDKPEPKTVGDCPVRYIREVQEDGTDIFIGDASFVRSISGELMGTEGPEKIDWENKQKREEENNKLPVGDPNILWSFGDFLAPSHHRRGIMTDAFATLLHEWGIPRMAIRRMWVIAFTTNTGSVKVFQKNGFKVIATHENHHEAKGKMRSIHLLEWKYGTK